MKCEVNVRNIKENVSLTMQMPGDATVRSLKKRIKKMLQSDVRVRQLRVMQKYKYKKDTDTIATLLEGDDDHDVE